MWVSTFNQLKDTPKKLGHHLEQLNFFLYLWTRSIDIGEADSSTTKLYSDNSLKSVFNTKTITVEFGCSKADWPKMLADPSANIVFAYTYMNKSSTPQN